MTRDSCAGVCRLILPNKRVEVLAYGCTSAAATIGEETIFEQLCMRQVRAVERRNTLGSVFISLLFVLDSLMQRRPPRSLQP